MNGEHGNDLDFAMVSLNKDSVYGQRQGALQGMCIIANNSRNIYRASKAYKTGVVHGISMLPRNAMVKPEATVSSMQMANLMSYPPNLKKT